MTTWRQRATILAVVLFFAGGTAGMLLDEVSGRWESIAWTVAGVGMLAVFVVSREARADLVGDLPDFVHRLWRLRWRTVAAVAVLGPILLVAGHLVKEHAAGQVAVADHIDAEYDTAGTQRLAAGGAARVYADPERLPLLAAEHLHDAVPAEDRRYTPSGILLRYGRSVVAVLPDGRRGSRLLVMEPQAAFRALHAYVGAYWERRVYQSGPRMVRSALVRPSEADLRQVRRWLDAAERAHGVCYGWRVRIASGRAAGPVDDPRDPPAGTCRRHVVLAGEIDPRANRLERRTEEGEWSLRHETRLDGALAAAAVGAVDVGHGEMILGSTTWPNSDGRRPGKGLLERIGALPLLALHSERGLRPVPLAEPGAVPADARIAAAVRDDGDRDAQRSPLGIGGFLMLLAGLALTATVAVLVPLALARRALRRRWGGRRAREPA